MYVGECQYVVVARLFIMFKLPSSLFSLTPCISCEALNIAQLVIGKLSEVFTATEKEEIFGLLA